jgi:hypothetical protein
MDWSLTRSSSQLVSPRGLFRAGSRCSPEILYDTRTVAANIAAFYFSAAGQAIR